MNMLLQAYNSFFDGNQDDDSTLFLELFLAINEITDNIEISLHLIKKKSWISYFCDVLDYRDLAAYIIEDDSGLNNDIINREDFFSLVSRDCSEDECEKYFTQFGWKVTRSKVAIRFHPDIY